MGNVKELHFCGLRVSVFDVVETGLEKFVKSFTNNISSRPDYFIRHVCVFLFRVSLGARSAAVRCSFLSDITSRCAHCGFFLSFRCEMARFCGDINGSCLACFAVILAEVPCTVGGLRSGLKVRRAKSAATNPKIT